MTDATAPKKSTQSTSKIQPKPSKFNVTILGLFTLLLFSVTVYVLLRAATGEATPTAGILIVFIPTAVTMMFAVFTGGALLVYIDELVRHHSDKQYPSLESGSE